MKKKDTGKIVAGVLAASLAAQSAAAGMTAFAEDAVETAAPAPAAAATAETTSEAVAASTQEVQLAPADAAADSLQLTGSTQIPATLAVGQALTLRGTVASGDSAITSVTAGIYAQSGDRLCGSTVTPNAKTYDLGKLDGAIAFDALLPGSYVFRVVASNGTKMNTVLLEKRFTVAGAAKASDTLSISGGTTVPSTLARGRIVNVRGTLTSGSSNITSVTAGIYNSSGTRMSGGSASPNSRSYDLSRLDNYVAFNTLAEGTYTYRVTASNGSNTNYVVTEQTFTVGGGTSTSSSADGLSISGGTVIPDTLAVGRAVNVTGTVTSGSSNITYLTAGVYDSQGNFVTGKTIAPKVKSYDLRRLDSYIAFNRLSAGKYTYAVIASNASNSNYALVTKTFTVSSTGASTSSASDGLSISGGTNMPSNLARGKAVNVTGTVTSASSNITALTVGVYDSNGRFVTGRTIAPNATSYDLRRLDAYVAFNTLASGSYTYAVIATNASNKNYALVNKKFTVGDGASSSSSSSSSSDKLTISGGTTVPDTLAQGKAVNVRGTVTSSSSNITALTVGVYNASGKFVTGRTIAPNARSYDLSRLDAYVAFNKLSAGKYVYAVIASNGANSNYALVNKTFTVGSGGTSSSSNSSDALSISGSTTVPDNLAQGKALNVRGTVTSSSSNITALTVGVYDSGGRFVTGRTIAPNVRSYDLSRLDAYVAFNKLAAGKYVYAVIASNGANTNYALVNKTFTVGSGGSTASSGSDGLSISGSTSMPGTLNQGRGVIVRGTLTSASSNITSVTVGVYNSSGTMVTGGSASPNARSYNVNRLDSQVRFDRLAAGTYTYRVTASNNSNRGYTVVNQSFTVK